MILSQTKLFNIFPLAIELENMLKTLANNCDREIINYTPSRDLRINRLCFYISNDHKNSCLTIDCRNPSPAKYTTNSDNDFEQFCYYAQKKKIDFTISFWLKNKQRRRKHNFSN